MDLTIQELLQSDFGDGMKRVLGPDYEAFAASFDAPRSRALRLNPRKLSPEGFERLSLFSATKIPWVPGGYETGAESRPSQSPLYRAGAYYLQDAGAMTPAAFLPIVPGDRVLDLCAAPGGKATAAGAALKGEGILIANDVSQSRARALLRNLELFGISNMLVTSEEPASLAERFPSWFDKIILDAPCSGEGMFRKDPSLGADWTREKSQALSRLQKTLIGQACEMLRPGGILLYSTCTYEPAEDEEVIGSLLSSRPGMSLLPVEDPCGGFSPGLGLPGSVRIYPHRMKAEGHFFALLKKEGESVPSGQEETSRSRSPKKARGGKGKRREEIPAPFLSFLEELGITAIGGQIPTPERIEQRGEKLYLLPSLLAKDPGGGAPSLSGISLSGLSFLRCGLYLGDLRKDRFEPSAPLALALLPGEARKTLDLPPEDARLLRYLRGESIPADSPARGDILLTCAGLPLAFGRLHQGILKNKLPASWRLPPA